MGCGLSFQKMFSASLIGEKQQVTVLDSFLCSFFCENNTCMNKSNKWSRAKVYHKMDHFISSESWSPSRTFHSVSGLKAVDRTYTITPLHSQNLIKDIVME